MSIAANEKIRLITAASLFDGHDAAINIMRRIMQSKGAEIIHLGHNRSVHEIVEAAIEEDAHGVAITSYQGGHVEFFCYMKDLLEDSGCGHIKIFGGGGGTILPDEIRALHEYGIERIYSPDDGRAMGLEGMIQDVIERCKPKSAHESHNSYLAASKKWNNTNPLGEAKDIRRIARAITLAEMGLPYDEILAGIAPAHQLDLQNGNSTNTSTPIPVLGITGTGGAGKSSVTDEIVRRFLHSFPDKTIAVLSVDPSKKKSGGALLGDRIRMNAISHPRAYMHSMATRDDNTAVSSHLHEAIAICRQAGFSFIILESAGVGQSDASIIDFCNVSLYVMTPEYGAASQLEKINMLDYADVIAINKFDKAGALDALADVRKQYKRNHGLWTAKEDELPIVGTMASKFNDAGVNRLFDKLLAAIEKKTGVNWKANSLGRTAEVSQAIIPPARVRYLSEISDAIRGYNTWVEAQSAIASDLYKLNGVIEMLEKL
jgi:methylmalonyl-CoA mutase